ncbi:MAG: SoxR reducing system RseC family protein [Oscillospiraceae bacterium]|nr:SoxR reducing system RseC family protein [Oscillospiraceae bacterium]
MTQIATVEKILGGRKVEISVVRKTACGHDCEECAGCGVSGAAIYMTARCDLSVKPGDKVLVESSTKQLLGIAALVYLIPVVCFFLGYFLPFGAPEGARIGAGIAAFAVGFIPAVLYDRKKRKEGDVSCTVVSLR